MRSFDMICARKGCKNKLQPPLRGPAKYCKDPVCVLERKRKFGREYYLKAKPAKQREKIEEIRKKQEHAPVKPKRVVSKADGFDCKAPLWNCDRGTREGFKKYMDLNPVYFSSIFKGMTVSSAWKAMTRS
jgi:hypothetical protein